MNINDFLNLEEPEKYDFVRDTVSKNKINDYNLKKTGMEKYCLYNATKSYENHKTYLSKNCIEQYLTFREEAKEYKFKDPDGFSVLLQEIYMTIWSELSKKDFVKQYTNGYSKSLFYGLQYHIASDTMTSASTLVNKALKLLNSEKREKYKGLYKNGIIFNSINSTIALASRFGNEFYKVFIKEYPEIDEFLNIYHAIGNYWIVPVGFNCAKAGNIIKSNKNPDGYLGVVYDFIDLTLIKIKEWYFEKNEDKKDDIIVELMHERGDQFKCKKWLQFFGDDQDGWNNFIETMMFQDFVYPKASNKENIEGDYGEVIPFWPGHSWDKDGIALPQDIDTMRKAFKNITNAIIARSKKIIEKLNENKLGANHNEQTP